MVDAIVEVTGLGEIKADREVSCMEYLPSENMIDKYCTYIRGSKKLYDHMSVMLKQQNPGVKPTLVDEAIAALDAAATLASMDKLFITSGRLNKCLKRSSAL